MIAAGLLALALVSLLVALVQACSLRRHLKTKVRTAGVLPPISILKPLCGVDDGLAWNLRSFADLDYPEYEVLLGVRDVRDPAYAVACRAALTWPGRFRVVVQRGVPGLNPKVNQLITLEAAARHSIVVISDSNVRVRAWYLREIAALLEDPGVGLVTHPVVGVGERTLGAMLDNMQLTSGVAAGVVAAKRLAGRDIVVGKSMAMRRVDVHALGGFARLKDVLAEDFVTGLLVRDQLGKLVALAGTPVLNVVRDQSVARCFKRYLRWSVMQRRAVGNVLYVSQAFLHPLLFAAAAVALDRALAPALAGVVLAKVAIDEWAARGPRKRGFRAGVLLSPAKDLVALAAFLGGLCTDRICWRGNHFRVLAGTVLEAIAPEEGEPLPVELA